MSKPYSCNTIMKKIPHSNSPIIITILALGIKCGYYSIKMFENTRTKDRILNTI